MVNLAAWAYPLEGLLFLGRTPQLRQVVSQFLISVTATSAATTCGWLFFFYNRHVKIISKAFGDPHKAPGVWTKLASLLVVLAESTLPMYLLFDRRFEQLQGQLFDETLQVKGIEIHPMAAREREALGTAVLARQQQREAAAAAAAAAWRNAGLPGKAARLLLGGVTNVQGLVTQLVLKPEAHEGILIRKARGVITAVVAGFVPPLLPVLALRDSGASAARLLGRYWERKGVPRDADSHALVTKRHAIDYRSFGAVAAGLNYVPVLNWLLGLSNTVGAALLAADMEKKQVPIFVAAS
eukprot:GHUV01004004.1.p1 GENE.GHUV01004004.1~~GHUV01004004.1.p1  ORF type:complete len:297 (+),score=91.11 GHUV01004004.1:206-1096(+)